MVNSSSEDDMVNKTSKRDLSHDSNSIPGGKKSKIPKEPKQEEGCALPHTTNNASMGSKETNLQQKTNKHEGHSPQAKTKKTAVNTGKKNSSRATSMSTSGSDVDQEGKSSSTARKLSPRWSSISIHFDDSDDENCGRSKNSSWAKMDIMEYRHNYPSTRSNPRIKDNLRFYKNELRSHPEGDFIDNIHKNWFGSYKKLEYHHGYIQWLFPLQERGLNISAEPLQKHEIEAIRKDDEAWKRILTSYKMMLDFYGFRLVDEKTGEIERHNKCEDRFHNLNTSSHNYLRITRILKCLGEFDYEYLKFPFLEKILREAIIERTIPNCLRSCKDYWIETLRSQDERRAIRQYARELIKYRTKGIAPPKIFCAIRPTERHDETEKSKALTNTDDITMKPRSSESV